MLGNGNISKTLFFLGAIGGIVYAVVFAWFLGSWFFHYVDGGSQIYQISDEVLRAAEFLIGLGILGLYRFKKSIVPLGAIILLYINIVFLLLGGVGGGDRTPSFPSAYLNSLIVTVLWLFVALLIGITVWMLRDEFGWFARLAAAVFMAWGFIRFGVMALYWKTGHVLWTQLWFIGTGVVFTVGFIYFLIAAWTTGKS